MSRAKHIVESLSLFEKNVLNLAKVPLEQARAFAESMFDQKGLSLGELLPDFDKNYVNLQKQVRKGLGIKRIDMPVIEPEDISLFNQKLKKGHIDLFDPRVSMERFPKDLLVNKSKAKEFLTLGLKDGDEKDDVVIAKVTRIEAGKLKPTQNEVWLENTITPMVKFGLPGPGSPVLDATIIVSSDNFILDGHHRWTQATLADPKLKMKALVVPLPVKELLELTRSFGSALGNKPKQ